MLNKENIYQHVEMFTNVDPGGRGAWSYWFIDMYHKNALFLKKKRSFPSHENKQEYRGPWKSLLTWEVASNTTLNQYMYMYTED